MILTESTDLLSFVESERQHHDLSAVVPFVNVGDLLRRGCLRNVFQPIMRVTETDARVFAYESLARITSNGSAAGPELFFRCAEQQEKLIDVELACIENTFRNSGRVPSAARIFVNVHPHFLSAGRKLSDALFELAMVYGVSIDRFVFEITEQGELNDDAATAAGIARIREAGGAFAFDDVGIAYSHLRHLRTVRPEFFKIGQQFGTAFETDTLRRKIVRNIAALAEDLGMETILEGVESRATAEAAEELGIRLLQGYFFGRPESLPRTIN
ncbi:MAG TPA: EAL domain-containing protein [Thermoanaerobaculia bacterium]|nr:EAL domain-containing protein [Thermoanaerobaculia bacterium]